MTQPDSSPTPPAAGPGRSVPRAASTKRNISVGQILGGVLLVLIVVFIVENTRSVPIRFIAGPEVKVPVYLALLIAAVVGALVGSLLRYRRKRNRAN